MNGGMYCDITSSWSPEKGKGISNSVEFLLEDGNDSNVDVNAAYKGDIHLNQPDTKDNSDCSCSITFKCQPQNGYGIVGLELISDARHLEVYSDTDEYLMTCRGEREDIGGDSIVYTFSYESQNPMKRCRIKFLSLKEKSMLWLVWMQCKLKQISDKPSGMLLSSNLDLAKVRARMEEMGGTVPDKAKALLNSVEHYQKSQPNLASLLGAVSAQQGGGGVGGSMAGMAGMMALFSGLALPRQQQQQQQPVVNASSNKTFPHTGVAAGTHAGSVQKQQQQPVVNRCSNKTFPHTGVAAGSHAGNVQNQTNGNGDVCAKEIPCNHMTPPGGQTESYSDARTVPSMEHSPILVRSSNRCDSTQDTSGSSNYQIEPSGRDSDSAPSIGKSNKLNTSSRNDFLGSQEAQCADSNFRVPPIGHSGKLPHSNSFPDTPEIGAGDSKGKYQPHAYSEQLSGGTDGSESLESPQCQSTRSCATVDNLVVQQALAQLEGRLVDHMQAMERRLMNTVSVQIQETENRLSRKLDLLIGLLQSEHSQKPLGTAVKLHNGTEIDVD